MSLLIAIRDGAFALASLLLAGLVSANVRQLAAAKKWDNFFLRGWDFCAALLPKALGAGWKEKWWFWISLGLSAGIAGSLWAVSLSLPPGGTIAEPTAALRTQIADLQAALETTTHQRDEALRRAGMPVGPPPVVVPPTADEARAKLSVWRSVEQLMGDLNRLLDQGDAMLDSWLSDAKQSQSAIASRGHQFAQQISEFRLKLESAHDSFAGSYGDVAGLLKEAVRAPGRTPVPGSIFDQVIRSSEGFANELNASANSVLELQDRMEPHANILRKNLQAVRIWDQHIKQTATVNRDALAKASR
jgi:ElaB/YqjD/DUF883 family membrane-anchored ribosome-binding protein